MSIKQGIVSKYEVKDVTFKGLAPAVSWYYFGEVDATLTYVTADVNKLFILY